jgi:hypothetical protein
MEYYDIFWRGWRGETVQAIVNLLWNSWTHIFDSILAHPQSLKESGYL